YNNSSEWLNNYRAVYRANSVIAGLKRIPRTAANSSLWDFINGQAYFFRAKSYLMNVLLWAPAFDEQAGSKDLGIPLREDDDFNKQILNDKKIQENSKVEFSKNKALKISSKTSQKKLNEEQPLQEKSDSIAIETKKKKEKSIKSRKKSAS
ncbi:MAG: hypothetical protein EOO94_02205, partial [Pedobacter sp.]